MAKLIQTGKQARESLTSGARQLAIPVTITLGPKGRNVALDKKWSAPNVIHDGVSVAKEIELKDPFENMGAQLIKEASTKTADRSGDGTTTSTLLAWRLIEKGMRLIEEDANPMIMKEGMEIALDEVVTVLTKNSHAIKKGDIGKVATISAADPEVGNIITVAMERVGVDGVITVEEGMGEETTVEYKDGMMFENGYMSSSPYFVTDKKAGIVEIYNPMILYTDMVIDSMQDFSDFLDNVLAEQNRSIVIICDSFQGYTLPVLIENHRRGTIKAYAVKAPMFGIKRLWMLEDMATITGGTVITRQSGRTLASIKPDELGHADKVWADADNTKILGGQGAKEGITHRVETLREQLKKEEAEFEQKGLRERIARLTGGAAIIKVGARTEAELKDKKERITDAVEATKSAVAEGIIAGGGIALLQCQKSLRHLQYDPQIDPDVSKGIKLVIDVLSEPITKILQNAGKTPEIILERLAEKDEANWGYDVITNTYGDMYEMGILDPVKVTRQALQNAVSVASMILTTEALVTEEPNPRKNLVEEQQALL